MPTTAIRIVVTAIGVILYAPHAVV
jgi:hypothetical protein